MSNRGDFVGSAPTSGNYIPTPVPDKQDDLPVYVNDELLRLGGVVNGMLEGGALPPHSELPKRYREGMIMNFSKGVGNGVDSSGVWLYKNKKWWKLIDDPTTIAGLNFIYKLTTTSTAPSKPPTSGLPPTGWETSPPTKNDKGDYIWVCSSTSFDELTGMYEWSQPTIFSAGVVDGSEGSTGSGFYTGDFATIDWTEPTATQRFTTLTGRSPVKHDIFIQNTLDLSDSEGREYDGTNWNPAGLFISGSIIASGTIAGDRFQAGTRIQAGNGASSASLDGANPDWRIYAGSDDPTTAPFKVDKDGIVYAKDCVVEGDLTGSGFNGVRFKIGTFKSEVDGSETIDLNVTEGRIYNPTNGSYVDKRKSAPFTTLIGVSVTYMGPGTATHNYNFPIVQSANSFTFNRDDAYDGTHYFSYMAFGI